MKNRVKSGIKILEEAPGVGSVVGDKSFVLITYSCYLNRGEILIDSRTEKLHLGDRSVIAGLRYGIEGMKVGGRRKFKSSPHLCYREDGVKNIIPEKAVLIFDVKINQLLDNE